MPSIPRPVRVALLGATALAVGLAAPGPAAARPLPECADQVCFYDDAHFTLTLQTLTCPTGRETAATRAAWSKRANGLIRARTRGQTTSVANGCRGAIRLTSLDFRSSAIVWGHSLDRFDGLGISDRRFRLEMPAWDVPGGSPEPRHTEPPSLDS